MDKDYITFSFNKGQSSSESNRPPVCGISLLSAGNALSQTERGLANRKKVFSSLNLDIYNMLTTKQVHSKDVFAVDEPTPLSEGDGIITCNASLIPTVVVADCMPIFLFEPITGCFGVLHSGWAGTGIVEEAIDLAQEKYSADAKNFFVILGPHIRSCCYTITEERAEHFKSVFDCDCITIDENRMKAGSNWPYRLSLAEANLSILEKIGVPSDNILDTNLCTCCSKQGDSFTFGSHRRETEGLAKNENRKGRFTQMVAFITRDSIFV